MTAIHLIDAGVTLSTAQLFLQGFNAVACV